MDERNMADYVDKATAWDMLAAKTARISTLEAENARLRNALTLPEAWTSDESEGMMQAYTEAEKHHGRYESCFAVAAFILRHRGGPALSPKDGEK